MNEVYDSENTNNQLLNFEIKAFYLMTLTEVQDEIIHEFEQFTDWMDKYDYIIDISKDLEPIDVKHKVPENVIQGCQSRVWLVSEVSNGKIVFTADSDSTITKGIIALLIRVLSGRNPDEIMNADLYFIDKIGLRQNLSPTRSNGLLSMVKQMKMYGLAYHTKLSQK